MKQDITERLRIVFGVEPHPEQERDWIIGDATVNRLLKERREAADEIERLRRRGKMRPVTVTCVVHGRPQAECDRHRARGCSYVYKPIEQ
jgi:hypothetical protein